MQFVELAAGAAMWWHGDLLHFGAATYSELASEVEGDGKYEQKTLRNAKWVCDKVPLSQRRDNLSFTYLETIAALPAAEQKRWLKKAEKEGLSVANYGRRLQTPNAL